MIQINKQIKSRKRITSKQRVLITLFIISVTANLIFYLISINPIIVEKLKKDDYLSQISDENYIMKVIDASIKMCYLNKEVLPVNNHFDFFSGLMKIISKKSQHNDPHKAYLINGLVDIGISSNDTVLLNNVIGILKKHTKSDGSLAFKLEFIDQVAFGFALCDFDSYFENQQYKKGADEIYDFLKKNIEPVTNLILYRPNDNRQFVDALGVICPFLIKYGTTYKDSSALRMACQQINFYINNGLDCKSRFPYHGVNIKNNLGLGSSNWGRGIGWYVLALAEAIKYTNSNNNPYYSTFCDEMDKIYINLMSLRVKNYWGQFITGDSADKIDTSTTTFLLYAFALCGYDTFSKYNVVDLFKPYTTTKGYLDFASGDAFGIGSYSPIEGKSEMSQGMLLSLLSICH
jgi:unsaturated rhamnogalacturonyl hydrolase